MQSFRTAVLRVTEALAIWSDQLQVGLRRVVFGGSLRPQRIGVKSATVTHEDGIGPASGLCKYAFA